MLRAQEAQITLPGSENAPKGAAWKPFCVAASLLVLLFSGVFIDLAGYASQESLHSHIVLVPFVFAYLVWIDRRTLPAPVRSKSRLPFLISAVALGVIAAYFFARFNGTTFSRNDSLSINVFAFVLLFGSLAIYFLGASLAKAIAFPLCFLIFLVPLPDKATAALEIASQYASAETYSWFMDLSRATYFREGKMFVLPNLTIVVAQECSGIRSSFVLFITSLIAGHLFLKSPWKKAFLAFLVFPLGILRNAFRIYVLSMLSAHWDPNIIHSPLHHRGGPIFFALSLIPFFLILFWLKRSERKKSQPLSAAALSGT